MANLPLAFAELLGGIVLADMAIKGASVKDVVTGTAVSHPLPGASSTGSAGGSAGGTGTYTNPLPGASAGRVDQGVDYTMSKSGFLAPGRSKILISDQTNAGWGGGGYIAGQLLDGPLAGKVWYAAEGVAPIPQVGQIVNAGALVARPVLNPFNQIIGNGEFGWADPSSPGRPLAQALSGYGGDQSSQALTEGYSFSRFIQALGGVAGIFEGAGSHLAGTIRGEFTHGPPAGAPY